MCDGMTQAALFYYQVLKNSGGALRNRYDNTGSNFTTPDFWEDDVHAIKLTSILQEEEYLDAYFDIQYRKSISMDRVSHNG